MAAAAPEALRLQLCELSEAEQAEADLECAYRLQLEEALQISLQSHPDPVSPTAEGPDAEQPSQTCVALQLQVRSMLASGLDAVTWLYRRVQPDRETEGCQAPR